jgi:hypothetical protein
VVPARILMQRAGHGGIYDLGFGEHLRGFSAGRGGDAVQPAIVRAQRLASSLSVMPGKCRRNSMAAANSPLSS